MILGICVLENNVARGMFSPLFHMSTLRFVIETSLPWLALRLSYIVP